MEIKLLRCTTEHPALIRDLYLLASEIVDDFEEFGPVLQANDHGEYDDSTTIRRLQVVRNELIAMMREASP